jgi:hypothetical protein
LLGSFYPLTDVVANLQQAVKVVAVGQKGGTQAGVLAGQRRHLPGQLHLHHPAHHGLELRQRLSLRREFSQKVLGQLEQPDHGCGSQILFAGKVLVQAGFGNADFGRHFVDSHQVKAFFGQQGIDRLNDSVFARHQHLRLERGFDHRLGRRAEGSTCRGNKGHHALQFISAVDLKYF